MSVVDCTDMKVHLDRSASGFHVEVGEIITTGEWVLQGTTATYRARTSILPEQRIEAYLHPCTFLPHADRFFRELKEGELADESKVSSNGAGMHNVQDDLGVGAVVLTESTDPNDYCAACNRSLMAHEVGSYCDNCNGDAR